MKKSKKFLALCLALAVAVQFAVPAHAESLFQIDGVSAEDPAAYGEPFDPQIFVSGNMGTADRWDDVVDENSIRPFDVQDVPKVTLTSIPDQLIGSYVTVRGTSSSPYYRMAAKYVYNGSTTWLGDVYSNNYSKQFKPASEGTYTVTLYSRSHPESNPRSASGSASTTFRIYHTPYSPNVKINNGNTANLYVGDKITVTATTAGKSYRMSAKYSCNGGTAHWLDDISQTSSYSSSFTATAAGTYTVTVYSRNYAESDPHSASIGRSINFTVQSIPQKELDVPPYAQPNKDTCGPTSVSMVLAKYNVTKSPIEVAEYITYDLSGNYENWDTLATALCNLLGSKNPGYTAYKFDDEGTAEEHYNLIKKNIDAGVPVIPLLGFSAESGGFPYGSPGHYVVIKGYYGTTLKVNDPFDGTVGTKAEREIANEKMRRYLKGKNSYIICAKQ